jgi:Tetraspanin family
MNISYFVFPQYIVLLILVFLLELSAGTLAYIYERSVPDELNMTLSETFKQNYAVSERHTKSIDIMQQKLTCCGAVRFEEYRQSVWLKSKRTDLIRPIEGRIVPDSCCVTMTSGCGSSDHPSNIPYTVSRTQKLSIHQISNKMILRAASTSFPTSFGSSSLFSGRSAWASASPKSSESFSPVACT